MTDTKQAQRMPWSGPVFIVSFHRACQLSRLEDWADNERRMYRMRAIKAADIGNRNAAIHFINRAQRCDSIVERARAALAAAGEQS